MANLLQLLTDEEKKFLQDYKRDTFFKRSLPIGLLSMAVCRGLMYKGLISQSRPLLKSLASGYFGMVVGNVFAYRDTGKLLLERFPNGMFAHVYQMPENQRREYVQNLISSYGTQGGQGTIPQATRPTSPVYTASTGTAEVKNVSEQQPEKMFSYAEQRAAWSRGKSPPSEQSYPASSGTDAVTNVSEQQPEKMFSYAEQRAARSRGKSSPSEQSYLHPDQVTSQPQSYTSQQQPQGSSQPFSTSYDLQRPSPTAPGNTDPVRKAKRNKYGDEME